MCVEKPLLLKNALRYQTTAQMLTVINIYHQVVIALVVLDTESTG